MKYFKVDQEVYSDLFYNGVGKVVENNELKVFGVNVQWTGADFTIENQLGDTAGLHYATFTFDGRLSKSGGVCLFQNKDRRPNVPTYSFNPGDIVAVRDNDSEEWKIKKFVRIMNTSNHTFICQSYIKEEPAICYNECIPLEEVKNNIK